MIRVSSSALAVCVLLAASIGNAQDFVPGILKYFPGKWEMRSADGKVLGTLEFNLVAGGKAAAGPGTSNDGTTSFGLAGWDPTEKKWVHTLFFSDGQFMHFTVTKFENGTYYGTFRSTDKEGQTITGEHRNRIIDKDHFEVTDVVNGESTVTHTYRIRD